MMLSWMMLSLNVVLDEEVDVDVVLELVEEVLLEVC